MSMKSSLITRAFTSALLLACTILFVGCGGDGKYPVSGTVTWKGDPIPEDHNGHIMFMPVDPSIGPDACQIGANGEFSLRASPGEKRVEILISRPKGKVVEAMGMAPEEMYVPRKYNEESELTATVKEESNTFDFALEP